MRVAGVVLAAGASSRFGPPKQLLPLGDTTLLGQVIRNASASGLDEVIVVLGREAEAVRATLPTSRARIVENTGYGAGCATSILAGLDAAEADAVALLLGDMPGVRPEHIDAVVGAWRTEQPWAAIGSWRGTPGHPFVFGRQAFEALRALHGDKGVFKLLQTHPDRVLRVPLDAELPADVDRPQDYERLKAAWTD